MIWQDWVLMVVGFIFSIALVPSILSTNKPSKLTCLVTTVVMIVCCFVYTTLDLWLTFFSSLLTLIMWGILLFQKRTK